MKILLTNDDGIDAPGISALHESVCAAMDSRFPDQETEIIVVAPDRGRSECGHSLETSRGLSVQTLRDAWFSVDGTPVDCIRVALFAIGFKPDLVFSGINAGANLGVNLMVSGTFAAAREASVWGVPAMAMSHYRRPDVPVTWDHSPRWLEETIRDFIQDASAYHANQPPRQAPLWNVNLPAVRPEPHSIPPRTECQVDRCPIDRDGSLGEAGRVQFEVDFHGRSRETGRDVDRCFNGWITVSKLNPHFHH